jgi:hypothetical protein
MPHCLDYGVEERDEDFHKFAVLPKNYQQAVATRNVGCGMRDAVGVGLVQWRAGM